MRPKRTANATAVADYFGGNGGSIQPTLDGSDVDYRYESGKLLLDSF